MLKTIAWKGGAPPSEGKYPFSVPAIRSLTSLRLRERVCFFTGENGSGKSTLLEAIAASYGMPRQGGSRTFSFQEERENNDVNPLADALQLGFGVKTGNGFFLRAESFFNLATLMQQLDARIADRGNDWASDRSSYHQMSHGESFFLLMETRMRENGLFLMDEPEAALSPQRQLSMLVLMHDVLRSHGSAQFIISTHSPILLGFPGAQILSFDDGRVREISYDECLPVQITRRFAMHRESFLDELFSEE